jgi:GxxExxY protein
MTKDIDIERIATRVIGCAIEVHRVLGPGLLESVYRECLLIELAENSLRAQSERRFPVRYKKKTTRSTLTVDILVEESVVVELKAIERIHPVHLGASDYVLEAEWVSHRAVDEFQHHVAPIRTEAPGSSGSLSREVSAL